MGLPHSAQLLGNLRCLLLSTISLLYLARSDTTGRSRTRISRFWRPQLSRLSYRRSVVVSAPPGGAVVKVWPLLCQHRSALVTVARRPEAASFRRAPSTTIGTSFPSSPLWKPSGTLHHPLLSRRILQWLVAGFEPASRTRPRPEGSTFIAGSRHSERPCSDDLRIGPRPISLLFLAPATRVFPRRHATRPQHHAERTKGGGRF